MPERDQISQSREGNDRARNGHGYGGPAAENYIRLWKKVNVWREFRH